MSTHAYHAYLAECAADPHPDVLTAAVDTLSDGHADTLDELVAHAEDQARRYERQAARWRDLAAAARTALIPTPTPDIEVSRDTDGHIDGLLCPDCHMDTIWPSWCTCTPQRVHTTAGMERQ